MQRPSRRWIRRWRRQEQRTARVQEAQKRRSRRWKPCCRTTPRSAVRRRCACSGHRETRWIRQCGGARADDSGNAGGSASKWRSRESCGGRSARRQSLDHRRFRCGSPAKPPRWTSRAERRPGNPHHAFGQGESAASDTVLKPGASYGWSSRVDSTGSYDSSRRSDPERSDREQCAGDGRNAPSSGMSERENVSGSA